MLRIMVCLMCGFTAGCAVGAGKLPGSGGVVLDADRGEVIVHTVVQHPEGKPCIDDWGQRVQAFAGCARAAGGPSKFPDFFVFLAGASTEEVYEALADLGARPRVHYPIPEAQKRSGLKAGTGPEDFLQGDPVVISVFWREGGRWVERAYEDFVQEKLTIDGGEVIKPWTPHFVVHGSGALHASGTGCIACPCDCAGGIIADNRYPVYNPKPVLRFDWTVAPAVGTEAYVRLRPVASR